MMLSRQAGARRAPRPAASVPSAASVTPPHAAMPRRGSRSNGRLRRLQSVAPATLRERVVRELRARPAR